MKEVLTVTELAEFLKVTTNTIYQMIKRKKIPFFKVGKRLSAVRFDKDEVEKWIKNQHKPHYSINLDAITKSLDFVKEEAEKIKKL